MNKFCNFLFVALAAGTLLFASCGEQSESLNDGGPDATDTSANTTPVNRSNKDQEQRVKKIVRANPSQMDFARIIQQTGIEFSTDFLLPTEKASNAVTQDQQSQLLGIYLGDLYYTTVFDELAASLPYLEVTKRLATDLGIDNVLNDELLERAKSNQNNRDSLMVISVDTYDGLNGELASNDGSEYLGGMLATAMWIEGLYLATRQTAIENDAYKARLAEQKMVLEDLMFILDDYQDDNLNELKQTIQPVVDAFNQVDREQGEASSKSEGGKITLSGGTKFVLTNDNLKEISAAVESVRNQLVK